MNDVLRVADMASYLEATGWRRRPDTWRGGSLWDHQGGHRALVPPRDGMDDAEERSWELLQVLTKAEGRPPEEIAEDISSPMMDAPFVRTFPADLPSGYIGLTAGLRVLQGIRDLFSAAVRVEVEGERAAFSGSPPAEVGSVLDRVRLGPSKPGSYVVTLRVSVESPAQTALWSERESLPRRALARLFRAVTAVHAATEAVFDGADYSAFDGTVESGVSANLCRALSDLGGVGHRQPFEVGFRWGRALPAHPPAAVIAFPSEAGTVILRAARQLERLAAGGPARITGLVVELSDEPSSGDRWRVRVRGELLAEEGDLDPRRSVWVRLSPADYQRAWDAHTAGRAVRARGRLGLVQRRVELVPDPDAFEIL